MAHSNKKEFTNPILNFIALVFIGYLVYWVFTDNYMKGKFIAATDPHEKVNDEVDSKKEEQKNEFELAKVTSKSQAKGQEVYNLSCKSCHGAEGKGDGVGSQTNPKPRNFHNAAEFKYGISYESLMKTLLKGSPGTSMAPFDYLPEDDRIAVTHYIAKWTPGSGPESAATADNTQSANADNTIAAQETAEIEWSEDLVKTAIKELATEIKKSDLIHTEDRLSVIKGLLEGDLEQVNVGAYQKLIVNTGLVSKETILKSETSFREFLNSNYVFALTGLSFGTLTNSELKDMYNSVKMN
jgi:mono/diheme cytochrome c family protein